jgi:Glycosyl hydrolase family 67 N-terminus./F5/8 type C domain.
MKRFFGKVALMTIPLLFSSIPFYGQVALVKNGKPMSRIVVASDNQNDYKAALLLDDFMNRISGCKLPVVQDAKAKLRKNDVVIGNRSVAKQPDEVQKLSLLKENGFLISSQDGVLKIVGGGDKGSIYGVVTLLEKYFGVDYWGENEYSLTKMKTLNLPVISTFENPTFRYRQTGCYAARTDSIYKLWYRLDEPQEVFAGGLWVHTFDKLLPSDVYGKIHPEYYAYFNGKRHPGKASQWCLTNPEVFEIVVKRVDSIFKANPDKHIISISQNDGNYTNCTCDNCKAIDDREGALSGSLIWFLNKLAARFPDKEFSTLAYLYTMNPPVHIKPLPNVNIMLCDIDCEREVSLTENRSGQEFVKAMKGWAAITNNIFVWDYGINFDGYLSPFPNFHILQDNIQLFRDHHATMHHSQIAGSKGGDFAELRAYLVAKLMWNADANVDSLMHHFLNGYYGAAGPYIYQYVKVMEGALLGSGKRLWIYDSPVSHKAGMLKPELMRRYNALFDQAEKAVANDEQLLKRVRRTRLPLQFSELEIARTESVKDIDKITQQLSLFESRVKELDVPTLNERNNSPVEYCQLYRQRYMPRSVKSLAEGAKVIYAVEPTGRYKQIADVALTDGLFGGSTFVESWVGWEGKDASFTVDLGAVKEFHSVETDFLHQLGQWILLPTQVTYSYSDDGVNFKTWEVHNLPEDRSVEVKFKGVKSISATPIKARYIKVDVVATKECPSWHYGVGHPSWFFVDEISVF